jgi:hypothetical protein
MGIMERCGWADFSVGGLPKHAVVSNCLDVTLYFELLHVAGGMWTSRSDWISKKSVECVFYLNHELWAGVNGSTKPDWLQWLWSVSIEVGLSELSCQ